MLPGGPSPLWAPKEGDIIDFKGFEYECFFCDGIGEHEWAAKTAEDAVTARFWGRAWNDPDPYSGGVAVFLMGPKEFKVIDRVENRKRPDLPTIYDIEVSFKEKDVVYNPNWHREKGPDGRHVPSHTSATADAVRELWRSYRTSGPTYSHSGYEGPYKYRMKDEADAKAFAEKVLTVSNVKEAKVHALRPLWERK